MSFAFVRRAAIVLLLSIGLIGCSQPVNEESETAQASNESTEIVRVPASEFKPTQLGGALGALRSQEYRLDTGSIDYALRLFKAGQLDGKGPQSHDEFVEEIMRPNGLSFPKLPDGYSFIYDPELEILMIEGPATRS